MRNVLAGLRVVDFCWVGAGAIVTKVLAEHGAEVIKVESRSRLDNLRVAPPFRPGRDGIEGSGYFASRNNDKRSFALNMREERSRELARQLIAGCDVVTSNFRPGVMARWGLGYEELSEQHPSLIYLSMPMQGSDGPHRDFIGFGATIAALSGLVELSGEPGREPIGTGTHYPDHVPSPGHALVALLAAIRHRSLTGRGRLIEVSQLESSAYLLGAALVAASAGGGPFGRGGNRVADASPSAVFRCAGEDSWCAVVARDDAEWTALATAVGRPELAADERFTTLERRKANEDALEAELGAAVRTRERWELAEALQAAGVPAWPVVSSEDLLADRQLAARDFWRRLTHPVIGELTQPGAPFLDGDGRTGPETAAPLLGAHTREVAASVLGLSDREIDELTDEKVLW
jgi:benzylsuccinate CoA-transferase BbsF subunit